MFFLRWQSVVDFMVLTVAVYWLLHLGRQTRVLRMVVGIGGLLLLSALAHRLDLPFTAWVTQLAAIVSVLLLVLLYYAEIRYALTHLDPFTRLARTEILGRASDFRALAEAAFALAKSQRGALIVLVGKNPLDHLLTGGVPLGGKISQEIIEAIFRKVSPVHDGATIIEGSQISRVGVFLPLTRRTDLPNSYGARHRSALGLAEQSDALVIVVSEERGEVSVVQGKSMHLVGQVTDLVEQLQTFSPGAPPSKSWNIPHRVLNNWKLKLLAFGLSVLIWALVFPASETTRTLTVPLEFQNLPKELEVAQASNSVLVVQLRATSGYYSGLNAGRLVVRVDLTGATEGNHTIVIQSGNFDLPPGIMFEKATPPMLTVRLVRRLSTGRY
jgi:uncharacterized protein (TIGR00159 family)